MESIDRRGGTTIHLLSEMLRHRVSNHQTSMLRHHISLLRHLHPRRHHRRTRKELVHWERGAPLLLLFVLRLWVRRRRRQRKCVNALLLWSLLPSNGRGHLHLCVLEHRAEGRLGLQWMWRRVLQRVRRVGELILVTGGWETHEVGVGRDAVGWGRIVR